MHFIQLLLPLLSVGYHKIFEKIVSDVLPLDKQVVHVRSLDEKIDTETQYPILDFIGLVEQHGYTAEEHNVTTYDKYELRLHRISGSPSHPKRFGKPVFYLQHGIGLSSDSWVLIGPGKDLAFLLADKGYDVWLGNVRGNDYSRINGTKHPDNPDFWEFSYHEMAIYDVKSFIDHILLVTGEENLSYYGYSMGTTLSYALLSTYPEYNAKIRHLYSVAPVVFWEHELQKLMKIIDTFFVPIQTTIEALNMNELLPQSAVNAHLGKQFCGNDHPLMQNFCASLFSNIGLDLERFNKSALPNILAHFPAGMSKYTVYHYNQNFKRKTFAAYDYGSIEKNMQKYKHGKPPVYDLQNVTAPTWIFHGEADDIVNKDDVELLYQRLPKSKENKAITHKTGSQFNHFDFLWSVDVKEQLYDYIIHLEETEP